MRKFTSPPNSTFTISDFFQLQDTCLRAHKRKYILYDLLLCYSHGRPPKLEV